MVDVPNLVLPLASSYNERGIRGFDSTVTLGIDQRKINSMYEPVKNALTGKTTLYLVKRPGVDRAGTTNTYGASTQVTYLTSDGAGIFNGAANSQWVYSVDGNDVRASDSSTTTVIVTAAGYKPVYVDKTAISGTDTVVLQLRNASGAQTVWYSTTIGTWTQISDGDFTSLTHSGKMVFMDGYAFVASTNNIYNSDINSLANWTASNYIAKQITQDPPVGLMKFGKQILACGRQTTEVFVNAGTPSGSPLQVVPSLFGRFGALVASTLVGATHYSAMCGGKLYFIGTPENGITSTCIVSYNGQSFEKVSTVAIDKILSELNGSIYSLNSIVFDGKQAIAVALTAPTASTQRWLMYFPEWNDWFEWTSTIYMPVNGGLYFCGVGSNADKLYFLSFTSNNWRDNGTDYTWTHQFQLPSRGNNRSFMPYMALKGDTARSAQNISVEFSDDDYQSFSTARTIDMTSKEKALRRCGSWKGSRVVRLSHTGQSEVRLEQFLARIE